MALFVDKNKRRKSPFVMICFCVALLFLCVYGAVYAFLTEPLYLHLSLGSTALTTIFHAFLMSAAGTAVCCLLFFLPDKRTVPGAYACLAVLLAIFYFTVSLLEAENRLVMLQLISLYGLGPVLVGNAVAWPIYLKIRGAHPAPTKIKTIREELREVTAKTKQSAPVTAPAPQAPEQLPEQMSAKISAETPPEPVALTEEQALFGPGSGDDSAAFRSAQEEAMLFYEDEENDD